MSWEKMEPKDVADTFELTPGLVDPRMEQVARVVGRLEGTFASAQQMFMIGGGIALMVPLGRADELMADFAKALGPHP